MLVLIGATPEGRKELVGFQVGLRESAQSWRELLVGLKARGLAVAPELATGDGALGFWRALEEVFPAARHQRCWVHKTANVPNKLPRWHCHVVWWLGELEPAIELARPHAANWTQVSCRQIRNALSRARRCWSAVIRCRRGRKWP
jgi:transposase-like protein